MTILRKGGVRRLDQKSWRHVPYLTHGTLVRGRVLPAYASREGGSHDRR